MLRILTLLCTCTLANAIALPSSSPLYDNLVRQYDELVGVYIAGDDCPSRSSEVIRRQRVLASALLEATPDTGPRVLLFAVTANSLENVRRLNEAGALRNGDNGSLLHSAARFADPPMLAYLTKIGFGVEDLGGASGSALFTSVTSNRIDNAKWLVDHGADVNATDTEGASVLRHAVVCRDQNMLDFLINAGAVADAKTREIARKLGFRL